MANSSWPSGRRWLLLVSLAVVIVSLLIFAVSNWGGGTGDDETPVPWNPGKMQRPPSTAP